jgi:hypothetical protein
VKKSLGFLAGLALLFMACESEAVRGTDGTGTNS